VEGRRDCEQGDVINLLRGSGGGQTYEKFSYPRGPLFRERRPGDQLLVQLKEPRREEPLLSAGSCFI